MTGEVLDRGPGLDRGTEPVRLADAEAEPGPVPGRRIRIVVADTRELDARGLALVLSQLFGSLVTVVGVDADLDRARETVAEEQPDLVLVDAAAPPGAELARWVKQQHPSVRVLALVADAADAWHHVVESGVDGVLPRDVAVADLAGPLLAVASGWAVLPPASVSQLVRGVASESVDLLETLDDDDLQLWAWVASGRQDRDIAEELYVSPRTVKRRVGALLRTLGVSRRIEAAELAGRLGLLARHEG